MDDAPLPVTERAERENSQRNGEEWQNEMGRLLQVLKRKSARTEENAKIKPIFPHWQTKSRRCDRLADWSHATIQKARAESEILTQFPSQADKGAAVQLEDTAALLLFVCRDLLGMRLMGGSGGPERCGHGSVACVGERRR